MAEDGKLAKTPRLRFPAFQDAPEWEEKALRTVCERIMDGTHFSPKSKHGPRLYLTSKNIRSGQIDLSTISFISEEEHREIYRRCPVRMLDVLLTKDGANTGNCAINPFNYEFSLLSSVAVLRSNPSQLTQDFLYQSIASERTQKIIHDSVSGQAITRITLEKLGLFTILVPSFPEQQRIADCLTSLDTCITAQARKVEMLKTHKRGLMQELFPREGEALPRRRFPEFRGGNDWIRRSMADLLDRASKAVNVDTELLYREIGVRSHGKGIFHKQPSIGEAIGSKRVFWVVANAFVVNIVFAWEQAVAVTSEAEEGMIASHRFPMYLGKPGKCDVRFLKYGFLTPQGKHLLGLASPGGAGRNRTLGQSEFEKIEMIVPAKLGEQARIADCLDEIDAQIAAESGKLDALKTHKKGLMQRLFPSPEAAEA